MHRVQAVIAIVHHAVLAGCLALFATAPLGAQVEPPFSDAPPVEPREEFPLPFVPRNPRSETEQDRIAAAAHYVQGRVLARRNEDAAALREYQRAWRYDASQASILAEVVPLAFQLGRGDEAARYAVIAAELEPRDATLLRRLAAYLAQQRHWSRALKMYERAWELAAKERAPDAPLNEEAVTLHLEMGQLYFVTDDFVKSAEHFSKLRAALDDPQSPLTATEKKWLLGKPEKTWALWGESFLRAKRYTEAAECFEKAATGKGNEAMLAFHRARVESGRGNATAALAKLDEYFAAKTGEAGSEPIELLGEIIGRQAGDEQAARQQFIARLRELLDQDAADLPLKYALAGELDRAGKLDEAARLYAVALAAGPTSDGLVRRVDLERRRGDVPALLDTLGMAATKMGGLESLGTPLSAILADRELVQKIIDRARQEHRDAPAALGDGALHAVALLALADKQFSIAEEFFELALAAPQPGRSQVLLSWAMGMFAADEYARAAAAFQRMLDAGLKAGGDGALDYYLAGALALEDKTDESLKAIRRAMAAEPENAAYEARLGWVLYHAKRYPEAERAYRKLLEGYDSNHKSEEVRRTLRDARLVLSNVALQQGDFAGAVEWLEQVLDEFPEDTSARNDLGYLWAERGLHLERALQMTQWAVAAEPDNRAYRDSLGWAYYQLGRYADAVRELTLATGSDEPDGVILDHLGDAYDKLEQTDNALATWKRAAAAFEKEGDLKKLAATQHKLKVQGSKPNAGCNP